MSTAIVAAAGFARAALRFWVGDVIGITVLTPFLMTRRRLIVNRPAPDLSIGAEK